MWELSDARTMPELETGPVAEDSDLDGDTDEILAVDQPTPPTLAALSAPTDPALPTAAADYAPPQPLPAEAEVDTMDNVPVRLSSEIDPRQQTTEPSLRALGIRRRRLQIAISAGATLTVVLGIVWAATRGSEAPSEAEASGATAATTPITVAAPKVAPTTPPGVKQVEELPLEPKSAGNDAPPAETDSKPQATPGHLAHPKATPGHLARPKTTATPKQVKPAAPEPVETAAPKGSPKPAASGRTPFF